MNRRGFFTRLGALLGSAVLPLPAIARITLSTRTLVGGWTIEPMQDLVAWHDMDLEDEMAAILAKNIREDIDQEILNDLRSLA